MPQRPRANPTGHGNKKTPDPPLPENIAPKAPLPPVPSELGPRATAIWHAVWETGGESYNPKSDAYVIERYVRLHDRHEQLQRMIDNDGITSIGSQGQVVLHPAARLISDVEKQLGNLEDKLGLNPESRLRLGISSIERESKLDAFLNAKEAS